MSEATSWPLLKQPFEGSEHSHPGGMDGGGGAAGGIGGATEAQSTHPLLTVLSLVSHMKESPADILMLIGPLVPV